MKQHFEKGDPQTKSIKVTVEEVKSIYNTKYVGENNTSFGLVVRKAFPGVQRARDSVSYYYWPLRRKLVLNNECLSVVKTTDKYIQTSESPHDNPTKEFLKSKVTELEVTNSTLKGDVTLLKTKLKNADAENKKLKANIQKRSAKEQDNPLKMSEVNTINSAELEGGETFIGEGTFGRCRLHTFTRTNTLVVVKEMKYHSYKALMHEAKIMQLVSSSPRFPFLFGVQTKPTSSIVMQFIGNVELRKSSTLYQVAADKSEEFVQVKNSMTKRDWVHICQDITEGLQHLHSTGLLHNDLKNNNVLIDKKRGFLIDLGKASDFSSPPPAKKYGTHHSYIAPEILKGSYCTYESDIFSLGQVFNFIRKFCYVFELRDTEKACTLTNRIMRPSAAYVASQLKELSLHL